MSFYSRLITPKFANVPKTRLGVGLMVMMVLVSPSAFSQIVTQTPLQVNVSVPGNLALVPSVEWPTIVSVANLGNYSAANNYAGYFDPAKCYQYHYSPIEAERHFYPVSFTANRACPTSAAPWSGSFLNWAATQTIDPFRSALTGGYRVVDTPTETWLEKARHTGQGGTGIYPNRRIPHGSNNNSTMVSEATPFSGNWARMRIQGLGNQMRIKVQSDEVDSNVIAYDPATSDCSANSCELSVRVRVCVAGLLEPNCVPYASSAKPEGTLQQYADSMRYSVFGYLNDSSITNGGRDGGVLRAQKKYIGPTMPGPNGTTVVNPNREWDPTTGVLIDNPNPDDATATSTAHGITIQYSGVINYLNRFGQMTSVNHKSRDPVSELYYAASRYFRNLGNVPEYSNMSGTAANRFNLADGFPVITSWDDPIEHWCQPNIILGIGDIYTHRDKNLPGTTRTNDEPSMPTAVATDAVIDVNALTQSVANMEGISINTPFTGRENSAYMAGLAWDLRSRDIRPDLSEGPVHVSTYWVDVLENQRLEGVRCNQYVLAAKYGGARLPATFDRGAWGNQALPEAWWHSNGETISPFGGAQSSTCNNLPAFKRPDNFFVAGEANAMVSSLQTAFANIIAESTGSGTSLAANSTKLETGTRTFQAQFFSGSWRGELNAYDVDPVTGGLSPAPVWQAGSMLPAWGSRSIYFHNPQGSNANQRYRLFSWANLGSNQQAQLQSEAIVNYLRGDRSQEEQNGGGFRDRTGALGSIVHSQPVFVGRPNPRLYLNASFNGASTYPAFVSAQASRTPVVYVGANDGMLHGFNADTGVETYAFIPSQVIANNLRDLSDPSYQHRYFVDGEMTVADVFFSGGGGNWRTVLVGTLGRGGPGIFALDVTEPNDIKFLWEKTAADIPALGRNIGKPVIAQVANGDWRVILGNGPDSPSGSAQLVMIGVQSGTITAVDTAATGDNGLSAVFTWDSNLDGFANVAYAGDLQGNLWKFSALSTPAATKLFEARDPSNNPQPITAAPLAGRNPDTGDLWVFFGTGRFLNEFDPIITQTQTWYGIIDGGALISGGRAGLVSRSILAEGSIGAFAARVIEPGTASEMVGKQGWYIDLVSPAVNSPEGERMVVPNQFQGRVLIGTTRIPDASNLCRPSGRGFVMAIDPFTGARLDRTFFDIKLDGLFNESDMLLVNGVPTIVSGVGFRSSPNNPIFIENIMQVGLDDGTTETMATQGSAVQARRTGWREILGN